MITCDIKYAVGYNGTRVSIQNAISQKLYPVFVSDIPEIRRMVASHSNVECISTRQLEGVIEREQNKNHTQRTVLICCLNRKQRAKFTALLASINIEVWFIETQLHLS